MADVRTFTISTRSEKGAAVQKTTLTVDCDCDREILVGLALQSLVIKRQGVWRKNGIPATESIKMADHAPGTRHAGESIEATILKLTPEQFAELQRKYEERKRGDAAEETEV